MDYNLKNKSSYILRLIQKETIFRGNYKKIDDLGKSW